MLCISSNSIYIVAERQTLFAGISVEKILKMLVIGNSYNLLYCLSLLGMSFEKIDC